MTLVRVCIATFLAQSCFATTERTLHLVAQFGAWDDVEKIIVEDGGDVNAKGFRNETLLHMAIKQGHSVEDSEPVGMLLRLKADINAKDSDNRTPIYFALDLRFEDVTVAQKLVELKAEIDGKDKRGCYALDQIFDWRGSYDQKIKKII